MGILTDSTGVTRKRRRRLRIRTRIVGQGSPFNEVFHLLESFLVGKFFDRHFQILPRKI